MLAVAVSPHGFTTALASEASIVPRASHREITLAACLGRVLGAEPQVGCCWFNSHSYSYSFVSHPPLQTVRATLTAYGFPFTLYSKVFFVRKFACMKQVMAFRAKHERFPVSCCHDLLPSLFSVCNIFHPPNVMNLK